QAARDIGHDARVRSERSTVEVNRLGDRATLKIVAVDTIEDDAELVLQFFGRRAELEPRRGIAGIAGVEMQIRQRMIGRVEQTRAFRWRIFLAEHDAVGPERPGQKLEITDKRTIVKIAKIEHRAVAYVLYVPFRLVLRLMFYDTMLYLRNLYISPFIGYSVLLPGPFWTDGVVL